MTLSNGRPYLAIPGPSVMPDSVLRAMMRPAPNIYEGELHDLADGLVPDLKYVAGTEHFVAIYIGNGHAVWEAALCNVASRGDKVLVPVNGRFGHGWADMAQGLHLDVEMLEHGMEAAIDPARIEAALRADTDHKIRAVTLCHVDTSTGIRNDIPAIRRAMDASGHPALLMVDCIASLGCDEMKMDEWGVDVIVAASQKGLMTPPGLGFVWFNDKADAARNTADLASRYWDWRPRATPDFFHQYWGGTAPTHHLYALRAALDLIRAEGLDHIWVRHTQLAKMIWTAIEAWGQKGEMRLNMVDSAHRSHAVTSVHLGHNDADRLRHWCENEAGVTLGIGLGRTPDSAWFRIGHMGHVNAHMVLGVIATIDAGLKALQIPHGDGAVEAATRLLAG